MRSLPRTPVALAVTATLAAGLAACGSSGNSGSAAAPEVTGAPSASAGTTPSSQPSTSGGGTSNAVLTPQSTGDPFADARTAAMHMPTSAAAISAGFDKALKLNGTTTSPAADLRATLTSLLQEHVYLAGYAVDTAYLKGAKSPEFTAAAATLDKNSQDIGAAVGSVAGKQKGQAFLQAWRAHIKDFVNYAVAAKKHDAVGKRKAQANLQDYAATSGKFFASITGGALPAAAVQDSLKMHLASLTVAIDDLAAGDPKAYQDLRIAADHMPMTADALTAGIVKAAKIKGAWNSPASDLRSGLTALLQEHVYLAGLTVFTAYTAGPASKDYKAAAATLDSNSQDLAKAVGSVSGAKNGKAFLALWRKHIGFFVDYALADTKGDKAGKDAALNKLNGYRGDAGTFFQKASKGALPRQAVADNLTGHVETLAGAIDSLAKALVK